MNITWNVVPLKRNFPPFESKDVYKTNESDVVNSHRKEYQDHTLNEVIVVENIPEASKRASKGQRNYFANRNLQAVDRIESDVNKTHSEKNLLKLNSERVNNFKSVVLTGAKNETYSQSGHELQTAESLNEHRLLVFLRRVSQKRSINEFRDLLHECNGNIDKAVDVLLRERVLCVTNILAGENKAEHANKANCRTVSAVLKQQVEDPSECGHSKKDPLLQRSALLSFHMELEDKLKEIVEQEAASDENRNQSSYKDLFGSTHDLIDASTQTEIFKENFLNYVLNGHEMVGIDFCGKLAAHRTATYRSEKKEGENISYQENICSNDFLPKSLAKDLYMLCMESFYNKNTANCQQIELIDENWSKYIRELKYENLIIKVKYIADARPSFRIHGMDKERKTNFPTLEIIPLDLSIHLALLKLIEEYPTSRTLLDILRHQNSYKGTVKLLLENNANFDLGFKKNFSKNTETLIESEIIDLKSRSVSQAEAKRFALTKFEESRNFAVHYCQLKGECYQKAKEMTKKGNSAVTVFFSHIADLHKMKMETYNQYAANAIVEVQKYPKENPDVLDLHYLHLTEAICCLDIYIDRHILNLRETIQPHKQVFVITGRGLHSSGGISTIKNNVKNRLKERNLRWNEVNPGLLKVKIFFTSEFSEK